MRRSQPFLQPLVSHGHEKTCYNLNHLGLCINFKSAEK